MSARVVVTAGLLAGVAHLGAAQQSPAVLKLDDGRQIVVSGLRRWTVPMIQDSLARYSPSDSLQSRACAVVLRYKLHFADAAVMTLRMMPGTPDIVFVDVREPQDSARVRYRPMLLDTLNPRPDWRVATAAMSASPGSFRSGVRAFLSQKTPPPADTLATTIARWFETRSSREDYRTALKVLGESPNFADRSVAALIVANYPDEQSTWAALLDAMRESDSPVKDWAVGALRSVAGRNRVAPDWKVLAPSVHAMLDGTSLFVLDGFIGVLSNRAEIGPKMARAFLSGGGEMLVNFSLSPQPFRAAPAHALLVKLNGADLGADAAAWRAWIAQLER